MADNKGTNDSQIAAPVDTSSNQGTVSDQTAQAATATKTKTTPIPELTIEDLQKKYKVPNWVMVGLKVANNWGAGKSLTDADFLAQRDSWLKGPTCKK